MKKLFVISLLTSILTSLMAFALELPSQQPVKGTEGADTRYAAVQPTHGWKGMTR